LSVRNSNNKHIEEEKDQREKVGNNEEKIFVLGLYRLKNPKKFIFILPTDRPIFFSQLACRTTN